MSDIGEITRLLERLDTEKDDGRKAVLEELMPLVYSELKVLARANRYRWSGVESLGTTSLVHEAYLKLADQDPFGLRQPAPVLCPGLQGHALDPHRQRPLARASETGRRPKSRQRSRSPCWSPPNGPRNCWRWTRR